MKSIFPEKSIFGFKVLNSFNSVVSAYLLISFSILIEPFFGQKAIELIASSLYILVSNTSIIILMLNSIFRRPRKKLYLWIFSNLALWVYFPFIIRNSIKAIKLLIQAF